LVGQRCNSRRLVLVTDGLRFLALLKVFASGILDQSSWSACLRLKQSYGFSIQVSKGVSRRRWNSLRRCRCFQSDKAHGQYLRLSARRNYRYCYS
jgi:hypothetical protein